jgi:hypothetical protein
MAGTARLGVCTARAMAQSRGDVRNNLYPGTRSQNQGDQWTSQMMEAGQSIKVSTLVIDQAERTQSG